MWDGPELVVRGRWHCEVRIVDGPHGTLWRAWDERLRRLVALRIVHAPLIGDPQVRRRIEKLLSVTAELQNDNMAYLYDVFEDDLLGVVLISEFVEGPTLSEVRRQQAPMAIEEVAAIGVQLTEGVAAIHDAGVAHRDLTPENVRITSDGTVKITGFSAARLLTDSTATPAVGLDDEGSYLAPEQLTGGATDERSDIYALGLLLWELATGAHPFELTPVDQAGAVATRGDVPPLATVRTDAAEGLSAAIEGATRLEPSGRWPDARTFGQHLQELCPGRPRFILRDVVARHEPAGSTS